MTPKNEFVNQNFASIDINTAVKTVIEFINTDHPDYLVIEDPKKKKYYLQQSKEALPALSGMLGIDNLRPFLQAMDMEQAPVIGIQGIVKGYKEEALVVEEGKVICIVNPVLPGSTHRSGTLEESIVAKVLKEMTSGSRGEASIPGIPPSVFPQSPPPGGGIEKETSPSGGINVGSAAPGRSGGGTSKSAPPSRGFETGSGAPAGGGSGAPPSEPPGVPSGPSTYYLNASCKDKAALEEEISLFVSIDKKSTTAAAPALLLVTGAEVEIVISPKSGFLIKGKDHGVIKVTGEEESKKCYFKLTATAAGEAHIAVFAFLDGMEIARMDIVVQVSAEKLPADDEEVTTTASKGIALSKPQTEPDITLLVTEETAVNGQKQLYFRIKSPGLYFNKFGPVILEKDPVKYFQDFFKDIEELNLATKEQKEIAQLQLKSKGMELYAALIPEALRKHLWGLKDRIKTVIINSEEPWIPWEICYFSSEENEDTEDGGFFCEIFETSRWLTGTNPPKESISFSNVALVVPGDSKLPYANDERDDLTTLLKKQGCTVMNVRASFLELVNNFKKGTNTLWHFTGHGAVMEGGNPEKTFMILEEGQRFSPENINLVKTLGQSNPFIFYNACQIGQSAMGLTGIGGWAQKFLEVGASGFIGAYWSIYDKAAYQFAMKFYEGMLAGETVARAAQEARRVIKDAGDPTWLAYTVYAYPSAKLV